MPEGGAAFPPSTEYDHIIAIVANRQLGGSSGAFTNDFPMLEISGFVDDSHTLPWNNNPRKLPSAGDSGGTAARISVSHTGSRTAPRHQCPNADCGPGQTCIRATCTTARTASLPETNILYTIPRTHVVPCASARRRRRGGNLHGAGLHTGSFHAGRTPSYRHTRIRAFGHSNVRVSRCNSAPTRATPTSESLVSTWNRSVKSPWDCTGRGLRGLLAFRMFRSFALGETARMDGTGRHARPARHPAAPHRSTGDFPVPDAPDALPSSRTVSAREDAPLTGVRVLDCSRVLAGPYCTVLLSFLGAEVVKVEDFRGDEGRQWPPHQDGMGASFLALNANKKSVAIDLKDPAGAAIVRELAQTADVLVENFKTGDMERFGLGYDDVAPLNPRLVYTSISAFGRRGPKARDPGYEALVQAYSGVMAITGDAGGGPVTLRGVLPRHRHRDDVRPRDGHRALSPRGHRAGREGGSLPPRDRDGHDVQPDVELLPARRPAAPARHRPQPGRALPGVRDPRRLRLHRRGQPEPLPTPVPGHRPRGPHRRRPVRRQRSPGSQSRGVH